MSLETGQRIGPYEILAPIGAGGMGEVYRARDTKLGREVAIKVLPDAVSADRDRLTRFEREARVLAALNHPNIATIYGVEETSGASALVMELVDGETLAEKLNNSGALPVTDALNIARQIADALDAAHEKGIVHRDLKPANIKVTSAGVVKVLDFGLAKAGEPSGSAEAGRAGWAGAAGGSDLSQSPTIASSRTSTGVILGTAAYMSPEQARGLAVDKRADTWAFGCVLYEMLTGRVAFPGDTVSDIIVSVLDREPAWAALPAATPAATIRLLRRCLEKDVRRRLRDIGDARPELDESMTTATAPASVGPMTPRREIVFQRLTDFSGLKESPAVSPDGKMVAFVALVDGRRQIWVRLVAGGALLQLTRDDVDHEQPRWAPDSSTLIYYTPPRMRTEEGIIWEISALGGWPRRVSSGIGGGDISHDGQWIALVQLAGEQLALTMVARDGSRTRLVTLLPAGSTYTSPRLSPDDLTIAFQRATNFGFDITLETAAVSTGERREVARCPGMTGFSWLPDGSGFVYSSSRGSTLLYPPVCNLRTVSRDGADDRQLTYGDQSYVDPDAHRTGKLLVSRLRSHADIWRFPLDGSPTDNVRRATRVTRQTGQVQTPSVSPDGTEVVYLSDSGGHGNLWVAKTDGSNPRQITFERESGVAIGVPKWSPRGDLIAFVLTRSARTGLSLIRPDGSGLREAVSRGFAPCWSADGRWLYYWRIGDDNQRLEKMPIDGGGIVAVREAPAVINPAMSPDGRTLYFVTQVRGNVFGTWASDQEICRASPEDHPAEVLVRVPRERIPGSPPVGHVAVSPDGQWLATSLIDGATTNLWALPAAGGAMRQLTDFGNRQIMIARSICWSPDSQSIYAAVAESETDIVLFDGMM